MSDANHTPSTNADLFTPVSVLLADKPLGTLEIAKRMREDGMSIIPDATRFQTHLHAPFMGREIHHISGPNEMRSVLMEHWEDWHKSPIILRMLRPVLGDAILTAHGESWRRQRMSMQPAFIKRRIERFIPVMARVARHTLERMLQSEPPVEVSQLLYDATYEVIETVLFTNPEAADRADVRDAIEMLLKESGTLRWSDMLPLPGWAPRPLTPKARQARAIFRQSTMNHIQPRRKSGDYGEDLLGMLLEARDEDTGRGLSDVDIRDTIMTFIAAGHETTAVSLTWALYLIANDPKTQKRLQDEAARVLGKEGVTKDNWGDLTFTRQVIEEAMRLFPPVPLISRQAVSSTELCGEPVRKGDVAVLSIYGMHRNQSLWDNPDQFDPDRWSKERRPQERLQYLPFGAGPRACIGASFAMMEATIMLATFMQCVEIAPVPHNEVRPKLTVTLRPDGGLPLNVERI